MLKVLLVSVLLAVCHAAIVEHPQRLRGGAPLKWSNLIKTPATLKDGFGTENKLEISRKSDINGETTFKTTFFRETAQKISHFINIKTAFQGVDVDARIDGSGKIEAEATLREVVPGVELVATGALAGGAKISHMTPPKIGIDFRRDDLVATIAMDGSRLDASGVFEAKDLQVGLATTYNSETGKLSEPNLALRYSADKKTLTAVSHGLKPDNVVATYTQVLDDKLKLAGTFSTKGNKFSLGGAYKFDVDTTAKAKLNSDGIVNLGLARRLTGSALLKAGLELDTNDVEKRKFGISITVE